MPINAESISIPANPLALLTHDLTLPFGGLLPESPLARSMGLRHLTATAGTEPRGFRQRHRQAAWIVAGTVAGTGQVVCNSLRVEVAPGDVYVIPPNLPFDETNTGAGPWQYVVLLAHTTPQAPLVGGLPGAPFVFRADFAFFDRFVQLPMRLNRRAAGDDLMALGLTLELLGECRRQAEAQRTGRKVGGKSAFVTRATAYLRERLRVPVSLATVARHCHMSPSTFSHRFKAETGLTPMNWLARERMQVARRLLLEGRTASETAAELGFANPFHFSRVFRKIEGVPPSRFQRLSRIPRGGGSTS